jgi:hypothetical protein
LYLINAPMGSTGAIAKTHDARAPRQAGRGAA